jgi:hypothetical protein
MIESDRIIENMDCFGLFSSFIEDGDCSIDTFLRV